MNANSRFAFHKIETTNFHLRLLMLSIFDKQCSMNKEYNFIKHQTLYESQINLYGV